MNLFLNKIDTDIRREVYEKTKDNKVHRKAKIKIYKDSEKNKDKSFDEYINQEKDKLKKGKNKIIIKASKEKEGEIILEAEKDLKSIEYGTFIDTKK
ncbi:hypothetical protein [Clostridium isatidis]|uniref:hypothetical protein n=1 Tax=Clostridium isatidis TaxID=182773 RepID=UPI003AAA7E83